MNEAKRVRNGVVNFWLRSQEPRRRRKRPLNSACIPSNHFYSIRRLRSIGLGVLLLVLLALVTPGTSLLSSRGSGLATWQLVQKLPSTVRRMEKVERRRRRRPLSRSSSLCVALSASVPDEERGRRSSANARASALSLERLHDLRREQSYLLKKKDFKGSLNTLREMIGVCEQCGAVAEDEHIELASLVDRAVQAHTSQAFAPPFGRFRKERKRVLLGIEAIHLHLSSNALLFPYKDVPRRTLFDALNALTSLIGTRQNGSDSAPEGVSRVSDEAFRILQRLVTGVGVRESSREDAAPFVTEKEFNEVLNAFANCGRMDMAHRVVALQERTAHAPALSPVTYSILLKGYGRLGDLPNVEVVLSQAAKYQIEPDTILLNTLIDAYINCNAMEKAREVFLEMKKPSDTHTGILGGISWPRPNRRTYNTMLKGFASSGDLAAALSLSEEMKSLRIWDAVTTNTLAHAAIVAGDLSLAEDVLTNHSVAVDSGLSKSGEHPNVEAYTELLDAYAKTQQLENALLVLQRMKQREVDPNEVTYTCLMGGFGRGLKVDEARKTLAFMDSTGLKPTSKVYHALVSGLVSKNASTMGDLDSRVDEAIAVLREMIQSGVRPNAVTVAILIEALGRCHHPRVSEASLLVEKLTMQRIIPDGNAKVLTGLVQSYGKAGDIEGALKAFGMMMKPDTVAVNAFLDACCRCNRLGLAIKTFDNCFRSKKAVSPDVISYSVLIGALFKVNTAESIRQARAMYLEMKTRNKIDPDTALVDVILKAMIRFSHSNRLEKQDLRFVASVIRDAEKLRWEDGQLERRKRGIQNALSDRMGGVRGKESLNALLRTSESTDDLLERKGWNKIDSGFRLWGGERDDLVGLDSSSVKPVDEFLESHGWNDVDSGFRLF